MKDSFSIHQFTTTRAQHCHFYSSGVLGESLFLLLFFLCFKKVHHNYLTLNQEGVWALLMVSVFIFPALELLLAYKQYIFCLRKASFLAIIMWLLNETMPAAELEDAHHEQAAKEETDAPTMQAEDNTGWCVLVVLYFSCLECSALLFLVN